MNEPTDPEMAGKAQGRNTVTAHFAVLPVLTGQRVWLEGLLPLQAANSSRILYFRKRLQIADANAAVHDLQRDTPS